MYLPYRTVDTTGDSIAWVSAEHVLNVDWAFPAIPVLGCWHGQVALAPDQGPGGGGG
jgi:hypothetical protein